MARFEDLRGRGLVAAFSLAGLLAGTGVATAQQSVRDFYSGPGKVVRFIVRTTAGGDYDLLSRTLGRHFGRHIPGNPTIVVENMPGGGGIKAANYMAELAPRDGTVLSIVGQGLVADQALGASPQLTADLRAFNWIANIVFSNPVLVVWHSSRTKSLEDAKHRVTTLGTTGGGSVSEQFPAFYNHVLGTKFKLIFGYPGGQEINLAMERGEVEGRGSNTYASYMASTPNYIPGKLVIPLIQAGLEKEPGLPDTPLLRDQAVKSEYRPLVEFMSESATVGRPLATTPGVPADRLAALRRAFDETVKDPAFIADAKAQRLEVRPMPGATLDKLIRDLIGAPQDVKEKVKLFVKPGAAG